MLPQKRNFKSVDGRRNAERKRVGTVIPSDYWERDIDTRLQILSDVVENGEDIIDDLLHDARLHDGGAYSINSLVDNLSAEELDEEGIPSDYREYDMDTGLQLHSDVVKNGEDIDELLNDVDVRKDGQEGCGGHVDAENETVHFEHVQPQCSTSSRSVGGGDNSGERSDHAVGGGTFRDVPIFDGVEITQPVDLRGISLDDIEQVPYTLRNQLSGLIERCANNASEGSIMNVCLRGPSLASDIQTVLRTGDESNTDVFLEHVAQVMQSNDTSLTDDSLEFVVSVAYNRSGGGRLKLGGVPYDEILKRKGKTLYIPGNKDNSLCFALCVARFLNPANTDQENLVWAQQVHKQLGFLINHKVGYSDVCKFEEFLDIKILVFHHNRGRKNLQIYQSGDRRHKKTIWLYLHNDHYCLIANKTGFFGVSFVCEQCYEQHSSVLTHKCKYYCNVCLTVCKHDKQIKCNDCRRICRSKHCFDIHKRYSKTHHLTPCKSIKFCEECCRLYKTAAVRKNEDSDTPEHICQQGRCKDCGSYLISDEIHQCFIQPTRPNDPTKKYIFYDFETRYHDGRHEANFVCAITYNNKQWYASGPACVTQFIQNYRSKRYRNYTFIAHNASGFDNYLVLQYFAQQGITPTLTMRGSRVILMYDKTFKQRWIDSFSFMPMRLAKTPEALGFEDVEKGYFPHRFNTRENEFYVGPYPEPQLYGYDTMIEKEKSLFMAWYSTVRHKLFDFQRELQKYGVNDVVVLRKACLVYRDTFMKCTDLDPFTYTTLASVCMAVYKSMFLPQNTVAYTFDGAYHTQHKTFSNVSIQWLEYVAHKHNTHIQHALNSGEKQFGPFFTDGYDEETHTAYEFLGCFFHGCPSCYCPAYTNPVTNTEYGMLKNQHDAKMTYLQNTHLLKVVVIWECEWHRLRNTDRGVQTFIESYRPSVRLNPRDALFGGRTNAFKLSHTVGAEEKIRYYDFTSLYPTVQSRMLYPVGHPQIIYKDFKTIDQYFGFVKCTVAPPRALYHPVLPVRCNGKLMFPLCRTCAEQLTQDSECLHSDKDRELSGTWVSLELQKAVEKGYKITQISEVWHFEQQTDSLFKGYVKTFLKCKQEASGYPSHVSTKEAKQAYVQEYYDKEGIKLNPANIAVNKAVRNCNKLILNSLWGRFSLRCDLATCDLISDPARFTQLMFSDCFDVRQFCFITDDVALVQWRHVDQQASRARDVNVFIGAFTTAHARLMLYDLLDRLQQRVLYCDTDSIIFVSGEGDFVPPLGPFLGDLTDEINDGDLCGTEAEDFIAEFVSTGPKCYAYHTKQNKTTVKCKGVTLNSKNTSLVTQQSLQRMVDAFVKNQSVSECITTETDTILRDKKKLQLKNATVLKRLQVVYNKRRVFPDYTTLPYGY